MTKIDLIVVLVMLLFFVSAAPFITIWSLNTLFSLSIAYTWKTWLATALLHSMLFGATGNPSPVVSGVRQHFC